MRRGEWAEAAPVSGIECVGLVKSCPGGEFPVGAKVAALMGGLGRTINGSYAEYTRAPASNVALIESDLPWAELAAIPITYATAWTCLFRNLEIQKGQLLGCSGDCDDPRSRCLLVHGEGVEHDDVAHEVEDRIDLLRLGDVLRQITPLESL
jgi:NADPH:quinone reductase-like Zn-dependent oxidoreductase